MDWLSQNWIWIALVIGGYFLLSRMGMGMGGCGMGHRSHGYGQAGSTDHGGVDNRSSPRAASQEVGQEVGLPRAPTKRSHQGHGCC